MRTLIPVIANLLLLPATLTANFDMTCAPLVHHYCLIVVERNVKNGRVWEGSSVNRVTT